MPLAVTCLTASKATAPGSAPGWCLTNEAPVRSAQIASCSSAAARKVSAAASATVLSRSWRSLASFPIVVVLPAPFTPTISHTVGPPGANLRARSWV